MIKKKICMLGSFAVGKTSLVNRFVADTFSERYISTIGVRIEQKKVEIADEEVGLVIWDIHGEDEFQKVYPSYLKGSSGYFLAMDGTRPHSIDKALELHELALEVIGDVPFSLLINKCDSLDDWEMDEMSIAALRERGFDVIESSAKSGHMVTESFMSLTSRMLEASSIR